MQVALVPSVFERGDREGWRFGRDYFARVATVSGMPWFVVDTDTAVDLNQFMASLQDAYDEADRLAQDAPLVVRVGPEPRDRTLGETARELRDILPKGIASEIADAWEKGSPSLDSTWHALDIQRTLPEIDTLQQCDRRESWFYHRSHSGLRLDYEEGSRLVARYIDLESAEPRGFRLSAGRESTICGLDAAFRIMAYHMDFAGAEGGPGLVAGGHEDRAVFIPVKRLDAVAARFIEECRSNGLIGSSPSAKENGTVFTTFGAYEVGHSLTGSRLGLSGKGESQCVELLKQWRPGVAAAIAEHFVVLDGNLTNGCGAFRNETSDSPCLSASYYALRTLGHVASPHQEGVSGIRQFFLQHPTDHKRGAFLDFVRLCWDPRSGGFSCRPNGEADVLHTRYALQVLRTLLHSKVAEITDIEWLNAPAILDYVMACYSQGGFAIKPGHVPVLFTTRSAVNSVKLLELMRTHECIAGGRSYREKRSQFNDIAEQIPHFVQKCNRDGGYAGRAQELTAPA